MGSESTDYYSIHTGTWTNWSHGKLFGATLTTTRTNGSLLIAFISLFITIVGTSFWRIGCFILHYIHSAEVSRDGLYHQRQAVLRNAANGATGLWSLCQVLKTWRNTAKTPYRRITPLVLFTAATLAAFAIASTFSSRISSLTGNEVLIVGDNCRLLDSNKPNTTETADVFQPYFYQKFTSSLSYAQSCYADAFNMDGCKRFVRRNFPAKIIRNATCPFDKDLCRSQDSNILLDTGPLASDEYFGLNTPLNERFTYRRVVQCAPLVTEGFQKKIPAVVAGQDVPYMRYYYGKRNLGQLPNSVDFTYQYPIISTNSLLTARFISASPDMTLSGTTITSYNGSIAGDSDMTPIQQLQRTDADVYLLFLSANGVLFQNETNDPWYSAHDFAAYAAYVAIDPTGQEKKRVYVSDEPASPLACACQVQYCNPNLLASTGCTPLQGVEDAYDSVQTLLARDGSSVGLPVYSTMQWNVAFMGIIANLGTACLDSSSRRGGGTQAPIPDYQWQLDVEKLNNISLAWLQQYFVDIATGPSDPRMDPFSILPRNENDKRTCRNQKILSSDYTNFSIFGLATTLVAGGLIIIVSYVLEPLVIWIQRRRNLDVYARVEWSMNQTLQLQRMAHEELGLGEWECCDADVPRTRRRERLAVLDLDDMKHPKLKAPPPVFDELLAGPVEKESARQNGCEKGEERKEPRAEEAVTVASEGSGDEEITQDGTTEGTEVNLPGGII